MPITEIIIAFLANPTVLGLILLYHIILFGFLYLVFSKTFQKQDQLIKKIEDNLDSDKELKERMKTLLDIFINNMKIK